MSPTLNGNLALQCFKHSNAVEMYNGIMFNFYRGLPHLSCLKSSIPVDLSCFGKLYLALKNNLGWQG